jgi:hypothetical protein
VKKNPPLPTVTVTVVALATPEHKIRSEVIVAAAITRAEELFIASIFQRQNSNDLPPPTMLKK